MKFFQLIIIKFNDDYKSGGISASGSFKNYLEQTEEEIHNRLCDFTNYHIDNYSISLKNKLDEKYFENNKIKYEIPDNILKDLIPEITSGTYVSYVWDYVIQTIELNTENKFIIDENEEDENEEDEENEEVEEVEEV